MAVEHSEHTHEEHHPGPGQYVKIAVILAIATALEVALFYIEGLPDTAVVGLLLGFMVVKFAMVVLYFMHLKFDSRMFRNLFVTGIVLAVAVYLVVLATFGVITFALAGAALAAAAILVAGLVVYSR